MLHPWRLACNACKSKYRRGFNGPRGHWLSLWVCVGLWAGLPVALSMALSLCRPPTPALAQACAANNSFLRANMRAPSAIRSNFDALAFGNISFCSSLTWCLTNSPITLTLAS